MNKHEISYYNARAKMPGKLRSAIIESDLTTSEIVNGKGVEYITQMYLNEGKNVCEDDIEVKNTVVIYE